MTNTELEQANKRIAELEQAIRGALQCRDLWSYPNGYAGTEESEHDGEFQMLHCMESNFVKLIDYKYPERKYIDINTMEDNGLPF